MRKSLFAAAFIAATALAVPAVTQARVYGDTIHVPERAIILTGELNNANADNIAVLYSRKGLAFDEPSAPRFLLLDRQGKIALGIGGYVKAIGMYDFDGAVDDNGFTTFEIPTPLNPAQRQRFGADASHSTLFLRLVTRSSKLGLITVYVQSSFSGGAHSNGFILKQAFVSVGRLTAGLATSTFGDAEAEAPTIDPQGPAGQVSAKNMMFQYHTKSYKGFSAAISAEMPDADYTTTDANARSIAQRFPDIPLYLQYEWNKESHIRVAALLRQLSYRDMLSSKNHFVTGWGVMASGVGDIVGGTGFFGHIAYGKGIARYINDLSGFGYDLVPSATDGILEAPGTLAWTAGLSHNFSKKFFMTANCSQVRVYDCAHMGNDAYKYGLYAGVNAFYNITGDLRIGAEYLYGRRVNFDGTKGHANRLEAMVQYSF
ncbi:MAG: porin [Muribaculaceae bacterium]|nr:porin [Muribaculaceae bacterium]